MSDGEYVETAKFALDALCRCSAFIACSYYSPQTTESWSFPQHPVSRNCPRRSGAAEMDRWRDPTSRAGARPRDGASEGPGSRLCRNKCLSEEQTSERPSPNELTPNKKLTVGQRVCCWTSGHNAIRQHASPTAHSCSPG